MSQLALSAGETITYHMIFPLSRLVVSVVSEKKCRERRKGKGSLRVFLFEFDVDADCAEGKGWFFTTLLRSGGL